MIQPSSSRSRKSIRLPGYDYSQPGAYFITVCAYGRECLFGTISQDKVQLSLMGQCAGIILQSLPKHFSIQLDEWVVMPNHIHAIVIIECGGEASGERADIPDVSRFPNASPRGKDTIPKGTQSGSLSALIQNHKSVSARKINAIRNSPGLSVWQRNYYEHIIRNDQDLDRVREYILGNPLRWKDDAEYLSHLI